MSNTNPRLVNGMTVDELLAFHREHFGDTRMEDEPVEPVTAASAVAEAPPTTIPTDLALIEDPDELQALLDSLTEQFDTQYNEGSRDIPALTALADDIDRVRAEQTARARAAAEADAAAEALAARIRPAVEAAEVVDQIAAEGVSGEGEGGPEPTPGDTPPADPDAPAEPPVVVPDPEAPAAAAPAP